MQKIIKIGEKEYNLKSSAYTQFAYKNETGRSFLQDLKDLTKLTENGFDGLEFDILEKIQELILPIAYVMIIEANQSQVSDYASFLKELDNLYDDPNWIVETILLGCSPISRQLQNS